MSPDDFIQMRARMVSDQIEKRGLRKSRLLEVFRRIPRHLFVPMDLQSYAYDDCPLPIGEQQTISQPYIVALMTYLLHLGGEENVLEIGTGSGYQAAILSGLCRSVHSIERHPALAERAQKAIDHLGLKNVHIHTGDGSLGWLESAPYQGILITAAAPKPPDPLLDQLDESGRMVIPIGGRSVQELEVWQKSGQSIDRRAVLSVAFVPLRGAYGWKDEDWPEGCR